MKTTCIIMLALASSLAGATTTLFTELNTSATSGNVTYTAPGNGSTMGSITGTGAWVAANASNGSRQQFSSSVTLTLDTESIAGITTEAELLRFDTSNANVSYSLFAKINDAGTVVLTIGYNEVVWANNSNPTYALSSLPTYTGMNGEELTTLTYVLKPINKVDNSGGVRVYSSEAEAPILSVPGMGTTSSAYNFKNILVNTDYARAFAVSNEGLAAADAVEAAATLATAPAIPEPATATLSLLALAGLAARRRRH